MFRTRILALCIVAVFATLTGIHIEAADEYSVVDTKGQHLDVVSPGGKPILRYVYARDTSSPETTFDTAKVFAHVIAPNGETTLTKGPGGKFPHHRGIFIGWNKLKQDNKLHDLWHVKNTALLHEKFLKTEADKNGATVTSVINWIGTEGEPVIQETRTHQIIDSKDAYVVIDFISELKAVNGDVELNGDPEHAGTQFRPSQQVAENKSAKYVFHQDGLDLKKDLDLPWVAETFKVDDEAWTVQHMNHPSNPKGAKWSAYRDYGRFGPFTVVKIDDDNTQTFRYRFRITSGEAPSREQLAKQFAEFSEQ